MDSEAGVTLASPTPTPTRVRNNCEKLRAKPDPMANRLNSTSDRPSTHVRA